MIIRPYFDSIKGLASYYTGFFEIRGRDNGESFVCLRDDRPQELGDLIHEAHQGSIPNNWIYQIARQVIENISDVEEAGNIVPDIYTHELINWLNGRTHLFDEALRDSGLETFDSICQYAQSTEISNIASIVESELETILSEQESEAF